MIKINKKELISTIIRRIWNSNNSFYPRRIYFEGKNEHKHETFFFKYLNMADGFKYLRETIDLIKLLNYIENGNYIKNTDDIVILEIIYMEIFEKLEKLIKDNRLDRKIINIYLLRKIGKRKFKEIIKEI